MRLTDLLIVGLFAGAIAIFDGRAVAEEHIQQLSVQSDAIREAAADAIRNERQQLVKELIEVAKRKTEPSRHRIGETEFTSHYWHEDKHLAILLLGDLRASEAVGILMEEIDYKNPRARYVTEAPSPDFWYPAVDSLIKIGTPSIEPVIERLGREEKEGNGRRNCLWIVRRVLGLELAKMKVQLAISAARNPVVRKNLSAALAELE